MGPKNDPKMTHFRVFLDPLFWPKIVVIYAKNDDQKVVQKVTKIGHFRQLKMTHLWLPTHDCPSTDLKGTLSQVL